MVAKTSIPLGSAQFSSAPLHSFVAARWREITLDDPAIFATSDLSYEIGRHKIYKQRDRHLAAPV